MARGIPGPQEAVRLRGRGGGWRVLRDRGPEDRLVGVRPPALHGGSGGARLRKLDGPVRRGGEGVAEEPVASGRRVRGGGLRSGGARVHPGEPRGGVVILEVQRAEEDGGVRGVGEA